MEKEIPNRQNTENRKKLIAASKELFYEQGYTNTTLAQISKLSGVNNGLITYYFGSKSNLASIIYTGLMLELRNEIAKQLYLIKQDYSLELGIGLENRILLKLKFENKNFLRFYVEYQSEKPRYSKSSSDKRGHYYQLQRRLINPSLSDEDLRLYEICGIAAVRAVTEAYSSGYYNGDPTYAEDYVLRLIYKMLQLPDYQAEALVEESRFLKDQLTIKVGPYFRLIN